MKTQTKELILQISICLVVVILLCITSILILANMNYGFKECENHPDSYVINFYNRNITCGELRAVNTTESAT